MAVVTYIEGPFNYNVEPGPADTRVCIFTDPSGQQFRFVLDKQSAEQMAGWLVNPPIITSVVMPNGRI